MNIYMKGQDLVELYQLTEMYWRTHERDGRKGRFLEELLNDIEEEYRERTGEEIREAGNPRKAGKKRSYSEKKEEEILHLYQEGRSFRQTAREAGCSVGHVQDVVKREKKRRRDTGCMEIN